VLTPVPELAESLDGVPVDVKDIMLQAITWPPLLGMLTSYGEPVSGPTRYQTSTAASPPSILPTPESVIWVPL
jgi:hypothetical protein